MKKQLSILWSSSHDLPGEVMFQLLVLFIISAKSPAIDLSR